MASNNYKEIRRIRAIVDVLYPNRKKGWSASGLLAGEVGKCERIEELMRMGNVQGQEMDHLVAGFQSDDKTKHVVKAKNQGRNRFNKHNRKKFAKLAKAEHAAARA